MATKFLENEEFVFVIFPNLLCSIDELGET